MLLWTNIILSCLPVMHQSFKTPAAPPPHWGIPGANRGFSPRFYSISRGIHLLSRLRYIVCGAERGVWRGFHSWFATSFRRLGSSCMFTILSMWQTEWKGQWCGATVTKDARSWFLAHTSGGWQRTQFHQEIGFATISIHLVSHTLSGGVCFGCSINKSKFVVYFSIANLQ